MPPKIAVMAILDFSRSDGMMVTLGQPMNAACAATDVARLPVEAQAAVVKPRRRALDSATETTRSLKEPVGLRVSSLSHSSRLNGLACHDALGGFEVVIHLEGTKAEFTRVAGFRRVGGTTLST